MALKLAYIGLSLLMTLLLIYGGFKTINISFTDSKKKRNKKIVLVGAMVLWHLYVYVLALFDYMLDLSFPPKFFLATIVPLFIFSGVFAYRNRKSSWLQNIPVQGLFFYQTFRILIEIIFVYTVAQGTLHPNVTIEGYNYDMVYAFSVLLIGLGIFQKIESHRKLVLAWNYLGLLVILSILIVFQTTIYLPEIYGDIEPFSGDFLQYPYVLVPAFLMPSAVFVHCISIAQLTHRTGSD